MKSSKEFMLLFRFEPNFNYQPSAEEMALMHQQWGAYIGGLAIQEKLIGTHQLGFEGMKISADQSVNDGIVIAESQTVAGNMVVKANSLAEAVEIAKGCPILSMGGNVEVRDILPM
ncbi:MAG: YciI family protein [Emticicia sp.]|nr:YciI family protein [Emticicia sp.]